MVTWETVKSTLAAARENFLSIFVKSAIVLIAAFSIYVFVKYFVVFSAMFEVTTKEVGDELDSVQVSSITDTNTSTSAFFRSFLLVVLGIGKLLITGAVMFGSFFIIEAHGILPATVLCFLYGLIIGVLGSRCFSKRPFLRPHNTCDEVKPKRLDKERRSYLSERVNNSTTKEEKEEEERAVQV